MATPGRLLHLTKLERVTFTKLKILVLDEANVLVGQEVDWSEPTSQGGIIEVVGTLPIRRVLIAPTRSSEKTEAGKRWLTTSYKRITSASETDVTSLLHISCAFVQAKTTDKWSELMTIYHTIVEILYKSRQINTGVKDFLFCLLTMSEEEFKVFIFGWGKDVVLGRWGSWDETCACGWALYSQMCEDGYED